jgi:tetratricopeptide (TPR) repeat protein
VDFNMHIPANAITAVVLIGILAAHTRFGTSRWWLAARWPVQIAAALLFLAVLWFGSRETLKRTRETYALRAADKLPDFSAAQIEKLKRAAAIEPQNPETSNMIAEKLRVIAMQGRDDRERTIHDAMEWYQRAIKLNRWDPFPLLGYGQCLDWLERHDEALVYFQKALAVDPNFFHTRAMMAWHYFQVENYAAAEEWNNKSLALEWTINLQALAYRDVIARSTEEQRRKAATQR